MTDPAPPWWVTLTLVILVLLGLHFVGCQDAEERAIGVRPAPTAYPVKW